MPNIGDVLKVSQLPAGVEIVGFVKGTNGAANVLVRIPPSLLGGSGGGGSSTNVQDWAEVGNDDLIPQSKVDGLDSTTDKVNKLSPIIIEIPVIKSFFSGATHTEDTLDSIRVETGWNKLADVRTAHDLTESGDFYLQDGITAPRTGELSGFTATSQKIVYLGVPGLSGTDAEFKVLLDVPVTGRTLDQTLVRFHQNQYQINTSPTLTPNWVTIGAASGPVTIPDNTPSGLILQLEPYPADSLTPTSITFVPVIHYGTSVIQCNDVSFSPGDITLDFTSLNFRSEDGYSYKVAEPAVVEHHSGLASLVSNDLDTKWVFGKALLISTVTDDHITILRNTNFKNSLQKDGVDVATQDQIDADEERLTALENTQPSGNRSQVAIEFDMNLVGTHTANTRIYTAPFDSVTAVALKDPTEITGDTQGITQTNLTGDNRIRISGLANDIHKIIGVEVSGVPSSATYNIISYQIPEHNNIIHHLLQVNNAGNYSLGNPNPTAGGSQNDVEIQSSAGTIAYQSGDWVVLSPAPLSGNNGVEFNVVVRRSNGTIVQANTLTFSGTTSLAQLHLDQLYFQTTPADNTEAAYVDNVVIAEHSGTDYIRHSALPVLTSRIVNWDWRVTGDRPG